MKWYGEIGFETQIETSPGVCDSEFVKRNYYGDVKTLSSRWNSTENLHDDLRLNVKISIMADPFLFEQFPFIKYIVYAGKKWSVIEITPNRPRIELTLGGLYNGI